MTRVWLVTLLGATVLSCSDNTVDPGIQLNLDRPVDIAFACYGHVTINGVDTITAQPPQWCAARSPALTNNKREPQILPVKDAAGVVTTGNSTPTGQPDYPEKPPEWYGFILQSASGTVAISRMPSKPDDQYGTGFSTSVLSDVQVLDADPRAPGKNAISIGEEPVALVTDLSSCYEVTANAGSCDLSTLDINSALTTDSTTQVKVTRMDIKNGAGVKLHAKPAAMVVQPNTKSLNDAYTNLAACPTATPTGLAYVAFPGCHVVAGIDLATGTVQTGIQFVNGVATVMSAADVMGLSCLKECGGAVPTDGTRPTALSLQVQNDPGRVSTRLAIGAENSATITVVDLDPVTFKPKATPPLQIALEATGKLGVTSLSLSPQIAMGNSTTPVVDRDKKNPTPSRRNNNFDTIGYTPDKPVIPHDAVGASPGGEGQYVYAVTTDGTVRVADVLNLKRECETQVDNRFVRTLTAAGDIPKLQCFPLNDPVFKRRSGARGPGIELRTKGPAVSVAIIHGLDRPLVSVPTATEQDPDPDPVPSARQAYMLIGYFAAITASSGETFLANVDDDDAPDIFNPAAPFDTAPVRVMAHQLRDLYADRDASSPNGETQCSSADPTNALAGSPRTLGGPGYTPPPNVYAAAKDKEVSKLEVLPKLKQEACTPVDTTTTPPTTFTTVPVAETQMGASAETRRLVFPDLRNARSETWAATWEGNLAIDAFNRAIDGPPIRAGQMRIDSTGMHLTDQTQPFCEMGVEPFDYVQMRGCNAANKDTDCPTGYTCYVHKDNKVPNLGACMLKSEASRLADVCRDFLTTVRRYTVARADSGELALLPRKHVLATTPLDGCTDSNQCKTLAKYATVLASNSQPSSTPADDGKEWACRPDDARAPVASGMRCVEACNTTEQCDAGTICVGGTGNDMDKDRVGTCMESVQPPQICVNGPQRFEVHASEAFTVIGSESGYIHPFVAQGNGINSRACVRDPKASNVQLGRIPLNPPACDAAAVGTDPISGKRPDGTFEPNPCATTVTQFENTPTYVAGTCTVASTAPANRVNVPAVKFRNRAMTLTLVDPWSPGDQTCVADRKGTLGKIPMLLSPGFATSFVNGYLMTLDLRAGYTPVGAATGVAPAFPVKVVRGPSDSMWVMDNGDVFATQLGQASTHGQVFRISVASPNSVNVLQ